MTERIDWICASEDGDRAWYPRSVPPWGALSVYAAECTIPRRRFRVRPAHLRATTPEQDCPVWPHGEDEYGDGPEGCTCYLIEEGWMVECDRKHPHAQPVWRIEDRPHRIRWWIRFRIRWFYGKPRPVIWGGRVDRRAFWFDRFLTGFAWDRLRYRDHWLSECEGELRWCPSCRATTPHSLPGKYSRAWCEAEGHGISKAAPMAMDVRRVA